MCCYPTYSIGYLPFKFIFSWVISLCCTGTWDRDAQNMSKYQKCVQEAAQASRKTLKVSRWGGSFRSQEGMCHKVCSGPSNFVSMPTKGFYGRMELNLEYEVHSPPVSQLVTGCVTRHTCHGCVTHFRPILGNIVEVTLVTFPILYIVSHTKGTSFP